MNEIEKKKLLEQITWDYDISIEDVYAVIKGEKEKAGHYSRETLFQKMIESYSWFTILQFFSPNEIKHLLSNRTISKLRSNSLKQKYEFVQKRLQQIVPYSG